MASKELTKLVQMETATFLGQHCQIWNGLAEKVAAELVPTVAPIIERLIMASISDNFADERIVQLKAMAKEAYEWLSEYSTAGNAFDDNVDALAGRLSQAMHAVPDLADVVSPAPYISLHQLAAYRNACRVALNVLETNSPDAGQGGEAWETAEQLLRACLKGVANG